MIGDLIELPGVEPSADLRERIAKQYRVTLLAFSAGKDSIASWLAIRDTIEIIPHYRYLVPDLEFVEESLQYYEKFFGVHIIRVPHPSLYRMIRNKVFCPPDRFRIADACQLPDVDYMDVTNAVRESTGVPSDTLTASGVRASDSIPRRIHFKTHGPVTLKGLMWYPTWDWRMQKLHDEIKYSGIKIPVDYLMFGRSFDGIDYRFLNQIQKYFPRDYRRILDWFPLAEAELKRREYARQN